MLLRVAAAMAVCCVVAVSAQDLERYFGIPLGLVHLSKDATSGELYAYDEYTILINHLEHHPVRPGCTSMMAGPARPSDTGESLIEGHGVLMGLAQPLVTAPNTDTPMAARHRRHVTTRRSRRHAGLYSGGRFGGRWPIEMDHLIAGVDEEPRQAPNAAPQPLNPFGGIHIRRMNESEARDITIPSEDMAKADSKSTESQSMEFKPTEAEKSEPNGPPSSPTAAQQMGREPPAPAEMDRIVTIQSAPSASDEQPPPSAAALPSAVPMEEAAPSAPQQPVPNTEPIISAPSVQSPPSVPNAESIPMTLEPAGLAGSVQQIPLEAVATLPDASALPNEDSLFNDSAQNAEKQNDEEIEEPKPAIRAHRRPQGKQIVMSATMGASNRLRKLSPAPVNMPSTQPATTEIPTTTANVESVQPRGSVIILGEKGKLSEPIEAAELDDVFAAGESDAFAAPAETEGPAIPLNPVETSRRPESTERREEATDGEHDAYKLNVHYSDLDLVRKLGGGEEVDSHEYPRRAPSRANGIQLLKPTKGLKEGQLLSSSIQDVSHGRRNSTPLWTVVDDPHRAHRERVLQQLLQVEEPQPTSTTLQPPSTLDSRFVLGQIREQLGMFILSNGAKLSDYHWFGLYNHCEQKHVELVSLRGVDPPREEKIMPLSGWSHNVSSYRVHILNCNTILVPGFTFEPDEDARSTTYFVAGIGQFPDNIERQVKAIVVGERPNVPLRRYANEDLLLRLPRSYRTFDIDFLSVYNTREQKSYGHVVIPSLLVPPCSDD